jgi:glucose-6-phosphate 1-dehydrogenase
MGNDTNGTENILVIFGITGDLAQRKLLPALRHIAQAGLPLPSQILGISRRTVDAVELLHQTFGEDYDDAAEAIRERLSVFTMDLANREDYLRLNDQIITTCHSEMPAQIIFYLSVPPQATLPIVEHLGEAGLNGPCVKLLLEKPFGVDLVSAEETIASIGRYYTEDQLYRIDHYLAKEMAQNIVAFRSYNAIFRNLWRNDFIEKIDIVASEQIGIEGRTSFYEQTGALRDFLQNHLMQLMALTLMEIPAEFKMEDLPRLRLDALKAIAPIHLDSFAANVIRGQYEGYAEEVANPGTQTETFVGLTLFSNDPNWSGVPIRLATGKNFARQSTEIRVYFKKAHEDEANLLTLHVQPQEGIEIALWAKKPGYDKDYEKVSLQFDYKQIATQPVEAYERVLLDAFASDKSLFASADEVLASWAILQPVQARWSMVEGDLHYYKPGIGIEEMFHEPVHPLHQDHND